MYKIEDILKFLPHRYPMLLVDRILEIDEEGKSCRGLKNVSINEAFFQGHYPDMPIMPGVLIIEAMAQVGSTLLLSANPNRDLVPLMGAIESVKFKRPVVPGDQLITDCQLLWVRNGVGKLKSTATVDGELVASMEMTFKIVKRDR